MTEHPIVIATRGSALALAQANLIAAQCCAAFPQLQFELKIIKTTGDKLQTASMALLDGGLPKGLFTKELEVALLDKSADMAVHSLKDLPTELPEGLVLAATPLRADVRDVLIYRSTQFQGYAPQLTLNGLRHGATIATSSTRRKAQLLAQRPDLNIVEIRGNVPTRMQKIAERTELDGTVLALAGLNRLNFTINPDGTLQGDAVPGGLLAVILEMNVMLPCVGQGAIGIEIRHNDERMLNIVGRLNHLDTYHSVIAERAFLSAMGGGCQSPVAAYAEVIEARIRMRAISFHHTPPRQTEAMKPINEAAQLGAQIAGLLK